MPGDTSAVSEQQSAISDNESQGSMDVNFSTTSSDYEAALLVVRQDRVSPRTIMCRPRQRVNEAASSTDIKSNGIFCEDCEMWLNGPWQYEDHLQGKKHDKAKRRSARSQQNQRPMDHQERSPLHMSLTTLIMQIALWLGQWCARSYSWMRSILRILGRTGAKLGGTLTDRKSVLTERLAYWLNSVLDAGRTKPGSASDE